MTLGDILEKKFSRSFKGYFDAEVDAFVAEVAKAVEKYEADLKAAKERENALLEKLYEYQHMDNEIRGALISAQQAARKTIEEAEAKARALLRDAQAEIAALNDERERLRASVEEQRRETEEAVERQAQEIRVRCAREMDALTREVHRLEVLRLGVRKDIEAILEANIGMLQEQLNSLDAAPDNSVLAEGAPSSPELVFKEYSPADIPGAEAEGELPRLDFER